jgi:hypothetical protein
MLDYSNGKIYKIVWNITNECYIGSTSIPILARRLAGHVCNYKRYLNGNSGNITSFKIIANGNYDIILIENFPCNSKEELHLRESHYTQTIQCVNKVKNQGLLIKLGQIDYSKQYNLDHKDHKKQYNIDNKDHIREHKKQYNIDNKDHIREKMKQKYHENKDKLTEKHDCQCGGCYITNHKARHLKTAKHLQWVNDQQI